MIIINVENALPFTQDEIKKFGKDYGSHQTNSSFPWGGLYSDNPLCDKWEGKALLTDHSHDYNCYSIKAPDGQIISTGDGYNLTPDKAGYAIEHHDGSRAFNNVGELIQYGRVGDGVSDTSLVLNNKGQIDYEQFEPAGDRKDCALRLESGCGYTLVSPKQAREGLKRYYTEMEQHNHEQAMKCPVYAARYYRSIGQYQKAKDYVMGV